MKSSRSILALFAALLGLAAAGPRTQPVQRAIGTIETAPWPYLPGSIVALRVSGFAGPYAFELLGPGSVSENGSYEIPAVSGDTTALLIAGNSAGLAATRIRVTPPPAGRSLLIVASYDDGLVVHDARTFSIAGVLGIGGMPSDVAVDSLGRVAAADTQGSVLTVATLAPWSVSHVDDVVLGDEVAIDGLTDAVFVTDRDIDGRGALTRVNADGKESRVTTGDTAEGLAIDERRQVVYVANANDGTVAEVDARSLRLIRRFHAVDRIFSLALSHDGSRLYGISNQSAGSPFGASGSAVALAPRYPNPRVVARSAPLAFPLGAALDEATHTLFVTDEGLDEVYVLDAQTLRPKHPPLHTCQIPWQPSIDARAERLYVPCAGSNAIDAFDAQTLRRVAGAPFRTGSYPLAVAVWHPSERVLPGKAKPKRVAHRADTASQ